MSLSQFSGLNTQNFIKLGPRQTGCHFADDILDANESHHILIQIALNVVRNAPSDYKSVVGSDDGLSPNRRRVFYPQPMKTRFNDVYMRHTASMS